MKRRLFTPITRNGFGSERSVSVLVIVALCALSTGTLFAFDAGEKVEVEWAGAWFEAEILQADTGKSLVHYTGWDSSYDEWVPNERIRHPSTAAGNGSGAFQAAPSGRTRSADSDFPKYAPGESVEVLYGEKDWYQAEVLKAEKDRYFIHYSGYDAAYDEWVDSGRIRAPEEKKTIYRPADRYTYTVGDSVKVRSGSPRFTHDGKIVGTPEGISRFERGTLGRIDSEGTIYDSTGDQIGTVDPRSGNLLDYWGSA